MLSVYVTPHTCLGFYLIIGGLHEFVPETRVTRSFVTILLPIGGGLKDEVSVVLVACR